MFREEPLSLRSNSDLNTASPRRLCKSGEGGSHYLLARQSLNKCYTILDLVCGSGFPQIVTDKCADARGDASLGVVSAIPVPMKPN